MPGGFLLLPEGMAFEDITPITHLDSPECGIHRRSHLNGYDIDHVLQRINLLGYSIYDRITELHCITGTNPEDIDYSDPNIYKLFENLDVCGIPNFSTDSCKQIMRSVVAQNIDTPAVLRFSDLVRILGINHGLGTWKDNAANLIKTQPFADLIGSREDIFLKLQEYGVDPLTVCTVTETIRKGRFYADTDENLATAQKLLDTGVPQWYVESMRKIGYLTSKAHTAHIVKTAVSLAWFKVHYPKEFYTVTLQDLGAEEFLHYSNEALLQKLETMERCDHYKDKPQEAIELLLEARRKNIPLKL
jgi:DNA polymerase-3 subunit alpha (Gram-positive type)